LANYLLFSWFGFFLGGAQGHWIPHKLSLQSIVDARLEKAAQVKGKIRAKAKANGQGPVAVAAC